MSTTIEQREWFYTSNGSKVGPVSTRHLRSLAKTHQLLLTDLVWSEGMSDWRRASTIKGLFEAATTKLPTLPDPPVVPPPLPGARTGAPHLATMPQRTNPLSNIWAAIGLTISILLIVMAWEQKHLAYTVSLTIAAIIYYDATSNRIGLVKPRKWLSANMSAGMWAFMSYIFWIYILPLYLIKRPELIEKAVENPRLAPARNLKLGVLVTLAALGWLVIIRGGQ